MKNGSKDVATAYHEAGHVVVAWCLDLDVNGANIVPDDVSDGRVYIKLEEPSTCDAIERGDRWHTSRLQAEKRVMMMQAGGVAQLRYNHRLFSIHQVQTDLKYCFAILLKYAPNERVRDAKLHYYLLYKWTKSLIEQHWPLVEAVAEALLDRPELSGDQILDVIHAANQEQTRTNVTALMDVVEAIRQRRIG